MRALTAVCNTSWAILPSSLETILQIANRESTDAMLAAALERRDARLQAVAAQTGRPLDGAKNIEVRDGIAIIPVVGPIVRYADLFSEMSGATSIQTLGLDFTRALNDPSVTAICLSIDSPGGEVNGTHSFARMVYEARGVKPIIAYVGDTGASAAYWIASATDRIVVAATALVGSIGVVAAVPDPTKTNAKEITFVSSQSPKKRNDPNTEGGKQEVQRVVDDIATVFVRDVAEFHGVTVDTVLADFGQGSVFVGQHAVDAGMADSVGSFEQTLADLHEQVRMARTPQLRRVATTQELPMANLKDMFKAMFSAMDETAIGAEEQDETEPVMTVAAVKVGSVSNDQYTTDPDVAALRAELAKARAEGITTAAAAFAEMVIGAHKAYPAERSALMDAYAQAAMDDANSPLETPRTVLLGATIHARPAHHLTEELIPAGQTVSVLANQQFTSDANAPMTPERRKALLKLTPLGQAALNGQKN